MRKLYIAALVALTAISTAFGETRSPKKEIAANIETFAAIIKQLEANYVDSIDLNSIVKTGVGAMLSRLDPYTEYFDQKEQEEFMNSNQGEYAGIGSYITFRDNYVWVTGPRENSPAAKAGLRQGDKFLTIDGEDMKGKSTEEVSKRLRGPIGSDVHVRVLRPWTADSIVDLTITRDNIQVPAVPYYGTLPGDLGVIVLNQFSEKSATEFKEALTDLINNRHIKGLVIDLRSNPGGYLESAVDILGCFLPKGTEVLRTRGRDLLNERIYKTASKPIAPELPLVVLINGQSASASEITAGALQDLDRAVIIGNRSYGKGLVQSTFSLPHEGMMKVTIAKYYIPSGRLIQAIDYSNRNDDGSVSRVADSLTNEFRTAAGRIVRDGGGITPDITIDYPDPGRLTYNLVTDLWTYDFANKYVAEHPERPDLESIEVTDSIYADFKRFIDPERLNYDRVCEQALKALRELAEAEGYMSEEVDSQITALEGMMKHSLDKDLDTHRKHIAPFIKNEIAERYYFDRGRAHSALSDDIVVDKATEILRDPAAHKALLAPAAESKSSKKKK